MNDRTRALLCALGAAALLAGCASGVKLNDTPVESRTPVPVGSGGAVAGSAGGMAGAAAGGTAQSSVTTVDLARAGDAVAAPVDRIVYFDFDSFEIKDLYKGLIEGHAKSLAAQRAKRMSIEGHADERGGREYNLALGQKRAEAVARALALLGVGESQVEPVSFGEERPAAAGHDEESWAKNRRVELRDR